VIFNPPATTAAASPLPLYGTKCLNSENNSVGRNICTPWKKTCGPHAIINVIHISPNPNSPNPKNVQMQLFYGKKSINPYSQVHFTPNFQQSKFWAFQTFLVGKIRSYLLTSAD